MIFPKEGWHAHVEDWDGNVVYDGPTPVPEHLVTLTIDQMLEGKTFSFRLDPPPKRPTTEWLLVSATILCIGGLIADTAVIRWICMMGMFATGSVAAWRVFIQGERWHQ